MYPQADTQGSTHVETNQQLISEHQYLEESTEETVDIYLRKTAESDIEEVDIERPSQVCDQSDQQSLVYPQADTQG